MDRLAVIGGVPISQAGFLPDAIISTKPGVTAIPDKVFATAASDDFQVKMSADLGLIYSIAMKKCFPVILYCRDAKIIIGLLTVGAKTATQETLLNSKIGNALQWAAGVIYLAQRARIRADLIVPGPVTFKL